MRASGKGGGGYQSSAYQTLKIFDQFTQEQLRREELIRQVRAQEAAMQAAVATQNQEMQRLQAQQAQAEANQRDTVAGLQAQEQAQLAQIEKNKQATNAAGASLRILATKPTTGAPTAQMAGRQRSVAGVRNSSVNNLKIGASRSGSGVGTNLGV